MFALRGVQTSCTTIQSRYKKDYPNVANSAHDEKPARTSYSNAGQRGQRQNRRGRSESLLADKRLNIDGKVTDITGGEARYTPGSCIAAKQKSPVWESQPGHNDRRSFR